MSHIRWAQNEGGKVVLEGELAAVSLDEQSATQDIFPAFLHALSISRQPRANLRVLYQGWLDTLAAYQASLITGVFVQSKTDEQAAARRTNLLACRELEQQIASFRAAAVKEKLIARRVEMNIAIKKLEVQRLELTNQLSGNKGYEN